MAHKLNSTLLFFREKGKKDKRNKKIDEVSKKISSITVRKIMLAGHTTLKLPHIPYRPSRPIYHVTLFPALSKGFLQAHSATFLNVKNHNQATDSFEQEHMPWQQLETSMVSFNGWWSVIYRKQALVVHDLICEKNL